MAAHIDPITPSEIPVLLEMIRELARFERLEHELEATTESLRESLFGQRAVAGALLARDNDVVAGYAIALDMTVRGTEDRSFRKSIDTYAVLGPWFVTADEIPDPDAVPISLTVNGEKRQDSNTSQLIYNCRRLIEFASEFYSLYPGDLLYTGTPEGVGPVKPGDVIVCRSAPVLGELAIKVRAHEPGRVEGEQLRMHAPA